VFAGFVHANVNDLAHLLIGGSTFAYQQGTPEAKFGLSTNVMSNRRLVNGLQ
jgi:hypothetical protein